MAHQYQRIANGEKPRSAPMTSIVTLVLWIGCLAIGICGLKLRYPGARVPQKEAEPAHTELIDVQISNDRRLRPDAGPPAPPDGKQAPKATPAETVEIPALPPLAPVAAPGAAVAFAVPVEGPTRLVEAKQALPRRPADTAAAPARDARPPNAAAPPPTAAPGSAPQQLTFGEGEGKQPAPEYPREAVIARQEGTVVVRFTVGTNGRVRKAEASTASSSALLNQAAVRAVRETWRFSPGPVRSYEVSIQFELKER
jgi:protein TonB